MNGFVDEVDFCCVRCFWVWVLRGCFVALDLRLVFETRNTCKGGTTPPPALWWLFVLAPPWSGMEWRLGLLSFHFFSRFLLLSYCFDTWCIGPSLLADSRYPL